MRILLIQGANIEYLGRREPELYGTTTAAELDAMLVEAHPEATPTSRARRSAGSTRRNARAWTGC